MIKPDEEEDSDFAVIEELNELISTLELEIEETAGSLLVERETNRDLLHKNAILSQINSEDQQEIEHLRSVSRCGFRLIVVT